MLDNKSLIKKLKEKLNQERRAELISAFSDSSELQKELQKVKESRKYDKGGKSKVWRKIAHIPMIVDLYFTDVYGPDYYKDDDFFKNHFDEWLTVEPEQL